MKLVLVLAAVLGIVAIGSANSFATAGTDPIFMKYGTIKGDVTAQGYDTWISLDSFQFGISRPATMSGTVKEFGAPVISEITITKPMDVSSTQLLQEALAGTGQTVTIDFAQATGTGPLSTYAQYVLTNAVVTGYSVSSGGDRPMESISISFSKVSFTYTPETPTGGTGTPSTATWDLTTQKLS